MNENDRVWRRIASTYVREDSAVLRRELDELDRFPTLGLDEKIRRYVAQRKRARRMRVWGTVSAACLVAVLLTPSLLRLGSGPQLGQSSQAAAPSQSAGQPQEAAPSQSAAPSQAAAEIIPLSFSLPEQFSVASVELDQGKTVYALEDRNRDPVVMTLERGGDTAFFSELTPLTLEGRQVYGRSDGGYHLLAFEQDGIVYELTCAYDLNTLADLTRSIPV